MERINPLKNERGFTLVEMLIAFLLMTIGVITSLSMITTAMNSDTIANRLTAKAALAQQVMEELLSRKADDSDISNAAVDKVFDLNGSAPGNDINIQGAGTFTAVYTTSPGTPIAGITQIDIKITSVFNNGRPDINPLSVTCYKRTI